MEAQQAAGLKRVCRTVKATRRPRQLPKCSNVLALMLLACLQLSRKKISLSRRNKRRSASSSSNGFRAFWGVVMGVLDEQGQGGLLSFLKSPEGQGLLAGGFAALGGRSVLGGISRGGLAGLGAYGQAQDAQQTNARLKTMDDRSGQMFNLQLQQHQASLDQAKKAQETQQGQRNYLGAIGNVTSPRLDAQPNQFSPTQWMALGGTAEDAQRLSGMKDWGKSKVARTVEGVDAQGNKVTYQMDEFGRPVGDATQAYVAPVQVDLGGRVQFVRPEAGVLLGKTMTPGESASNAVARGNLAVSQQRLALDQNKPEFKDGQWVVAPRDMRPGESRQAVAPGAKPLTDAQAKAYLFGTRMQESDKLLGQLAAGGTDRRGNIKATLESVPLIGDGLGTLANGTQSDSQQKVEQAQRDFLNAVLRRESGAAIAPSEFDSAAKQYFPQPFDSAAVKEQKARNRQLAVQGIMAEVPGGQASASTAQPKASQTPQQGAVVDGYVFRGGNPSDPHNWAKVK
jgi:hypothetical protein